MAEDKKDKNTVKGLAGELALYEALRYLAKEFRAREPILLGEPSPEIEDPVQIAEPRRSEQYSDLTNLPDVYWRVDDIEILAESKNLFLTWLPRPPDPTHPFYEMKFDQPRAVHEGKRRAVVTAESIIEKKWGLREYPIRGTSHTVRENGGRPATRYNMMPILNIQSVTKFLITTLPSIQDYAWKRLDAFFDGNIVFTHHAIIEPFVVDSVDITCQDNVWAMLVNGLKEKIEPLLDGDLDISDRLAS